MYSTKRKFHSLLDSLTAPDTASPSVPGVRRRPVTSTASVESDSRSHAKKPRVQRPVSSLVSGSTSEPSGHERRRSSGVQMPSRYPPIHSRRPTAPNFAPWDRDQFLNRLKTFRHVDKWSAKPTPVTEVQWAKRGWTCIGKERVGCVGGCGRQVFVKLGDTSARQGSNEDHEDQQEEDDDQALIERYAAMILTGHEEDCLWRRRGCDDTIYHLGLNKPFTATAGLRSRYESLVAIAGDLPAVVSTPLAIYLSRLIEQLPPDFHHVDPALPPSDSPEPRSAPVNPTAFALALFGWEAEEGHIQGLATCGACFRRLGLWLFKDRATSDEVNGGVGEEAGASMSRLDVESEHRDYCPWINAATQNGGTPRPKSQQAQALSGWEALVRALGTMHHPDVAAGRDHLEAEAADTADEGVPTEVASARTSLDQGEGRSERDAKDSERWAKLKKIRQAFNLKGKRKKSQASIRTAAG
ncbi:MAG: hypothetical protein M1838_003354 [Thelocarpon superellum]|nr:MAG: hypothetical protein M1838_003354 [Thelocarpon superellum]